MAKDLAIVLSNGSVNSAVAAALANQKFRLVMLQAEIAPNPGSRTRAAYEQQVAFFKPYREHSMSMPFLQGMQPPGDPIVSDPRHPTPLGPQMLELLTLVSAAARFAGMYQAAAIYLGVRVGSNADALAQVTEYVQIWNELLQLPCNQPELELVVPLLELDPWQVIDVGFQANAPFDRTWSCVEETSDPCWACPGCRQREQAFMQAGKPDPLRVVRKV